MQQRLLLLLFSCDQSVSVSETEGVNDLSETEQLVVKRVEAYLTQPPVPITTFRSERSQGGIHDFYSEGDYWWSNPDNPDGPYIRRDGKSNPDNFVAHRQAMRRLNQWVAALVAMKTTWLGLDPARKSEEINRTYPIREPTLWD